MTRGEAVLTSLIVEGIDEEDRFELEDLPLSTRIGDLGETVVAKYAAEGDSWPRTRTDQPYFPVVYRTMTDGSRRLASGTALCEAGLESGDWLRVVPGLDTSCLVRLYGQGGTLRADALRAGLPSKVVPFDLERDVLIRRIFEELEKRSALPDLFVLAALQWPEDEELRRNLSQLAAEGDPESVAPRAMAGMRGAAERTIRRIWREVRT